MKRVLIYTLVVMFCLTAIGFANGESGGIVSADYNDHQKYLTKKMDSVQDTPAAWAIDEVEKAIGKQLIPENMQGNYDQSITREEFCILVVRMIEKKASMSVEEYIEAKGLSMISTSPFVDCSNKDVIAANVLGIVDGTSSTTFEPNNPLTREQAAKLLSATASSVGQNTEAQTPNYADLDAIANWAKPYTGYVYNINVMKGVGGNRFNPKGGYQRQQAFATINRLYDAIASVSFEKVVVKEVEETRVATDILVSDFKTADIGQAIGINTIKKDIQKLSLPHAFKVQIEGTTSSPEYTTLLKYDAYYKNKDVRIETYWDNKAVSSAIYNTKDDATYVEAMLYTSFGEYTKGNLLPIRLLDIEYLEELEINTNNELFTAHYEILKGEKVLYIKSNIRNGVTTEMWYSLKYLIPVQFNEVSMEEGIRHEVKWQVVAVDETTQIKDALFAIPEGAEGSGKVTDYYGQDEADYAIPTTDLSTKSTRDLLLYKVKTITVDEKGIMDMTQIFYYSEAEFDDLTTYFAGLLVGSNGFVSEAQEEKTIIEGTLNGDTVIIIVNNYDKYEPQVGMNGININYFKE